MKMRQHINNISLAFSIRLRFFSLMVFKTILPRRLNYRSTRLIRRNSFLCNNKVNELFDVSNRRDEHDNKLSSKRLTYPVPHEAEVEQIEAVPSVAQIGSPSEVRMHTPVAPQGSPFVLHVSNTRALVQSVGRSKVVGTALGTKVGSADGSEDGTELGAGGVTGLVSLGGEGDCFSRQLKLDLSNRGILWPCVQLGSVVNKTRIQQ